MTKKHFEAFAKEIRKTWDFAKQDDQKIPKIYREKAISDCLAQIHIVCVVAKQFNSNFDENGFRQAAIGDNN